MKTVLLSILLAFCTSFTAYSQKKVEVKVVYLLTDSILKGEIIDSIPGTSITLKTLDSQFLFIPLDEIDSISSAYYIKSNNKYYPFGADSLATRTPRPSRKAEIYERIENKTPKRGVYKYYYEFLANAPSITDSFYVKKSRRPYYLWQDTYSLEPRYLRKNKKVRRVWGFSNGEQTYIFDKGEFFPIVVEEDELVFYGFDRVDNSGVAPAYIMGGVIGSTISAAAAQSNAKSQKIGYIIHPVNGTPKHPLAPPYENLEQKNELIVYRRSKKESDLTAKFLVDGDQLYSFEQKSYVLLKYALSEGTVTLCTGADFNECITVNLNPGQPIYVECTYPEGADSVQLILQERNQGVYDFNKVENTQDKRGKQLPKAYKKF